MLLYETLMSNPEAPGLEAVVAAAFNRYDYDASGHMVRLHLSMSRVEVSPSI